MKKFLAVFAAITLTAIFPVQAITFSLRTIYVASGVTDDGGIINNGIATTVHCTNLSGKTATVRVAFYGATGTQIGSNTATIAHLVTRTISTHSVIYFNELALDTGAINQGVLNIGSTESGVFCSAMIVTAAAPVAGIDLHMVRYNPHPGTVE
jgi:hypothetical protein